VLGVQARFLFDGGKTRETHPDSLQLIGYRGLALKIERGQIDRLRLGGPGNQLLLRWDSLPDRWRDLVVKSFGNPPELLRRSLFDKHYRRDMEAFDFYSLYRFDDDSALSDDKIEEYTVTASVLNTIREIYGKRKPYIKMLKGQTGTAWAATVNEAVRYRATVYHNLPDSPERMRKVFNRYKQQGYASLISGKHGNNNRRLVTPEVEIFINSLFADSVGKPSKEEISRRYDGFLSGYVEVINDETGEVYSSKDFPALSRSTIYAYLSKWHNAIATEPLRGDDRQKLLGKFKPYHSMEQAKYAGSIVSVDDRQPPFRTINGREVWFYNGIDLGSEAFICWVWGNAKEGIIVDFYRQMVRNCHEWGINIPAELECEASLNSTLREGLLKEGNMFQYVHIEPNNARGKRIERYFGDLRYGNEKEREGWLPRPHALSERNRGDIAKIPTVPYEQIVEGCLRDIENWNNTEHSKIKGKTRWEVFMEKQNPDIMPTNYRGIIPHIGYKTETSCHTGIIKLNGSEFLLGTGGIISVGGQLVNLMSRVEGRDIDVYWLDDNRGEVLKAYVYVGGEYVCEAVQKPIYNRARIERTPQDEANCELMSKYVSTIEAYGRRRKGELENLTIIDNRPKTLNRKFSIDGIGHYRPSAAAAEMLPDLNDVQTGFDSALNGPQTTRKRSLSDRY